MKGRLSTIDYGRFLRKYGMFVVLVILLIIGTILKPDIFPTYDNIISIFVQVSMTIILTCGICPLIIANSNDLSAGSVVALTGTVMVGIYNTTGSIPVSLLVACLVGGAIGFLNGFIIAWFALPAFIITLGTQTLARGLALLYANGMPIPVEGDSFRVLGQEELFGYIPYPVLLALSVVIVSSILMNHTAYGRALYAIGGNQEAARASGIKDKKLLIIAHIYASVLTALVGYILASRTNVGHPSSGVNYEFDAIIGAVLGGTSFAGGIGTIGGAVIGCTIMGVLANIMNLANISTYMQYVVKGSVIILAVIFDCTTRTLSLQASKMGK